MEIDFIMRNMFSVIIVDFLSQHTRIQSDIR